jgi:hypothetical protein
MSPIDVAIVGAGPYGLSVAAHLRTVQALEVTVFGETMSFWEHHMPVGMLLRSPWAGSHLSDPEWSFTLDAYRAKNGNHFGAPVPLSRFIDYGHWFQHSIVPDVDERQVRLVEKNPTGFQLTLNDGATLDARHVIVACGIGSFAWRPAVFENLPSSLVSHSSEHRDLSLFKGKQVLVVGAGQSALESAALSQEGGAMVEMLIRAPVVHWLGQRPLLHKWPIEPLLYAPPDVGPALVSHFVARPNWFCRLPRSWQDALGPRSIRPAGARWLRPRLNEVRIRTGHFVVTAAPVNQRLQLRLDDGSEHIVDHALLGTGYRVDISRYGFLSRELLASIKQIDGYPQLSSGFESSIRGLHFVGAPAAWSFGPLMRFVAGAEFTARAVFEHIVTASKSRASRN